MTGRLLRSAKAALGQLDLSTVGPQRVGALVVNEGTMLEVDGFPQPVGSTARIMNRDGSSALGEVVGFRDGRSLIQTYAAHSPFVAGCRVEQAGQSSNVQCGEMLLGRVIDALGNPIDGQRPIVGKDVWPLAGVRTNPLERGRVVKAIDVGVRAINGLLTIGEGQRVAVIAGSGVGKSVLIGQILKGVDCDIIIVGLVGERSREVSDFIETKLMAETRAKAVVVAVPADHPPLLRLRAAMRASALAEYFRAKGLRVLLLIDSLTRVAHAQREIGLALGEPPTMKGYPPSALGIIPQLVERAGVDRKSKGSITAIYTVLADGDDVDDPIVDAARAIVDGHIVLSRNLAEQGVYPAIDVAKSLSRTMVDVIDQPHRKAAAAFRRLWSAYEQNSDLMMMGAYTPGTDPLFDEAIVRRQEMLDFIAQDANEVVDWKSSHCELIERFGG